MRRLGRLSLAGLALLLWMPLEVAAQNNSGTLEVLVEDPSGPRSPDGTASLTFETRKVSNLERIDIGPGRSFTNPGQRIGTGSGTVITPTVTVSDLVTEASVYPQKFSQITGDAQGRLWVFARDPVGLYVFSDSISWRRVVWSRFHQNLGRDAQGRVWLTVTDSMSNEIVCRISGNTLTEYSGFNDFGVGFLTSLGGGTGETVWMGGYSVGLGGGNPALMLRFDGREWRLFSIADGLPNYSWIDAMAVDSTGTVWGKPVYDAPEHISPPDFVPSLISYDGREWRGYRLSFGKLIGLNDVGMLVDPGGTLWISTPYVLVHNTASGWTKYGYTSFYGWGMPSMAAERAGRIWIDGYTGGWIGVFESGQLHRTPSGSNPDAFVGQVYHARKLHYDGEVLWIANQRLARWRLPGRPTSVDESLGDAPVVTPGQSHLFDSYPNPFNASTTIGFELDRRQPVSLRVHNLTGQRVATLAEGVYPEGVFAVSWNGRDDQGREVAGGVYLYRLILPDQVLVRKMTLLR